MLSPAGTSDVVVGTLLDIGAVPKVIDMINEPVLVQNARDRLPDLDAL
jgi:hypothetical protein